MLANYIFNELSLDGLKGIGKKGKDNGVLVIFSLKKDAAGGSMRIEVGRGLEGNITDGIAGEILDSYLVPAKQNYERSGDKSVFDTAFYDTVVALADQIGYTKDGIAGSSERTGKISQDSSDSQIWVPVIIFVIIAVIIVTSVKNRRRGGGRRVYFPGSGGGWSGGGGSSGGGGAGR